MSVRNNFNEHSSSATLENRIRQPRGRCRVAHKSKANHEKPRFFPPWFLNKVTMRKIDALLPYFYHKRLRLYFDLYGCIRCSRKDVVNCCSGLCLRCKGIIDSRLKRSDRKLKEEYHLGPELPSAHLLKRLTTARDLLKDFRTPAQAIESRSIRRTIRV